MIKFLTSRRIGNLIGFFACVGMLAFGYYLQFAVGLEPCPLCILQRLLLLATGVAFFAAAVHRPARRLGAGIYAVAISLCAATGAAISARHVWIQHLPEDQRPSCGPALDYMLSTFGPFGSLFRILRGSGECGKVDWTLLSFSIPEWTLAAFLALGAWAVFLATRD
ncbi:MAG TPA: disulfide bond formation protein B [Burkholderiales bacterium]